MTKISVKRHSICRNTIERESSGKSYFLCSLIARSYLKLLSGYKRAFRTMLAGFIMFTLAIGINIATTDWQMIRDEHIAGQYSVSSEMKTIVDELNLTRKGRAVLLASQPSLKSSQDFNRVCGNDGDGYYTAGCYYKDNDGEHIAIYNVGAGKLSENGLSFDYSAYRKTIVLHEMMHAVWERQSESKQTELCKNLRTLSNQINDLKDSVSIYSDNIACSELFARVGSEYAVLFEKDMGAVASVKLNYSGREAAKQLNETYSQYFDTKDVKLALAHWTNERELNSYKAKLKTTEDALISKKQATQSLVNLYYAAPTWGRYYSANNSIREYNELVSTYNSYLSVYRKVYARLNSENTTTFDTLLANN